MGLVEILANYAQDLKYEDLPEDVVQNAKLHILDAIGAGSHAATLGLFTPVIKVMEQIGQDGESSVFGYEGGLGAPYAAFVNSIMLNSSAYQETHKASIAHPHSPCISTALAVGEQESVNGKDFIAATVAAYEVYLRICNAVSPSHLSRGFQTTGTIAPIGAAVACGKLIGLNRNQMKHALAHATNFSGAGFVEAHAAKPYIPMHLGTNVWKGIVAALLAKENATGADTILEGGGVGKKGFLQACSDESRFDKVTEGLGRTFETLQTGFALQCVATWARTPLEATLTVVKENGIRVEEIQKIKFAVTDVLYSFLPQTIATAQESAREAYYYIPFHTALALYHGHVDSSMYTDENLHNPKIRNIMEKVEISTDPDMGKDYAKTKSVMTSVLEIEMNDGRVYRKKLDYPKGDPENPATKEELQDKFRRISSKIISNDTAEKIISLVDRLEEVENIRSLGKLIRGDQWNFLELGFREAIRSKRGVTKQRGTHLKELRKGKRMLGVLLHHPGDE